ncbi:hypothetical protein CRG98_025186, partial [Punica granatum]
CGRYPPEVRTAIPVDGRFEHIVLSCNATSDHAIIWIEREAEKALERMKEVASETITTAPKIQKIERLQTLEKEHKDALERAVSLNIPHAVNSAEEECEPPPPPEEESMEPLEAEMKAEMKTEMVPADAEGSSKSKSADGRTNWDEVVKKLFKRGESEDLVLKREDHDADPL